MAKSMIDYKYKGRWTDIQVHLTNKCNHQCTHCYTSSNASETEWLSLAEFEKIVHFALEDESRIVRILGGEVIAEDFEIEPYLEIAQEFAYKPILSTNGYFADIWKSEELDPNRFKEIIISCYGFASAHDNFTRVGGSYNRTIDVITFLAKYEKRTCEISVNTIITPFNHESFLEFILFLCSLRIDEIKVLVLSPLGRAIEDGRKGFLDNNVDADKREIIMEQLRCCIKKGLVGKTKIVWERSYWESLEAGAGGISACRIKKESMLTIDALGNVYPCHLTIGQPNFIIGNLADLKSVSDVIEVYKKSGGGRESENGLLYMYNYCPAYNSVQKSLGFGSNFLGQINYCPLHLELLE